MLGPLLVNLQDKVVIDADNKSTAITGNIMLNSKLIAISKQTSYGEPCALLQGMNFN